MGARPERRVARLLVRLDPEGLERESRGPDLEYEHQGAGGAVEARHGRTAGAARLGRPLTVAPAGHRVRGARPGGPRLGRKRRNLIGHKLLDLVKSRYGKR